MNEVYRVHILHKIYILFSTQFTVVIWYVAIFTISFHMLCNKATCSAAKFTVSFLLLHNKVYSQFSYAFCLLKFTPFCLVLQAYIHSRMRAKTSDFLKVLNRARPEVKDKEKKTIRSAIFRSFMYLYIFLWSLLLCFRKFFVKNLIFLGKFSSNFLFFFSGKTFRQQWKSWVFRSFEKSFEPVSKIRWTLEN